MKRCEGCGHHHLNWHGHPEPCHGIIYNDSGGISRCTCPTQNENATR